MTESAPGKLTRQELYDQIRETSKEEYTLNEMKRLGFWPDSQAEPHVAEQVITRISELTGELKELVTKQRRVSNPEQALKDLRKQRLLESRKKREQTKLKNMQARYDRAVQWHERNKKEILFVGETVSAGLSHTESDQHKLARFGLPILDNATQLAQAMGISLSELRFLSYSRPVSRVHHYRQFEIQKKTGGTRKISTPMPRLKRAQYWILDNLLNKIPVHEAAHGFVEKKSIVSNARPHTKASLVINFDLQNFFPTITYKRIKGYLQKIGYSGQIASLIALLCTEHEVDEIELDNALYYVSNGERRMPQGAPTSPALSNLICFRLDKRLQGAVKGLGYTYTRYADDMTFSSKTADDAALKKLFWRVHQIIDDEGFIVHPDKTRIMRKGACQEVTGIVVNEKPGVNRKVLKRFKACLHQTRLDGIDGKKWGNSNNFISALFGFANYVRMVNPTKGNRFLEQVRDIQKQYGLVTAKKSAGLNQFRILAAQGKTPLDNWWLTQTKPVPLPEKPLLIALNKQKESEQAVAQQEESELTVGPKSLVKNETASSSEQQESDSAPGEFSWRKPLAVLIFSILVLFLFSVSPRFTVILLSILVGVFVWFAFD